MEASAGNQRGRGGGTGGGAGEHLYQLRVDQLCAGCRLSFGGEPNLEDDFIANGESFSTCQRRDGPSRLR